MVLVRPAHGDFGERDCEAAVGAVVCRAKQATVCRSDQQGDEASLGFDAIAEVGPGGHFFGTAHTLERYETAFYRPLLSDWRNFETWQADGAKTATERANAIWKQLLAGAVPPPLDPARAEALDLFVERRRREIDRG